MNFCSRAALAQGTPLAGTGVRGDAYVFVPVDKQLWGASELNAAWASPQELEAIKAARQGGVVTRLYDPGRAEAPAAILVHQAPDRPARHAVDSLLSALSQRWGVGAGEPRPRLAICTQGTRDRCCAKYGFAAVREAKRLFAAGLSPFEPLECSHLGGDRFAATGVFFPSGGMYAHLDSLDLAALARAEAEGRLLPEHYRGCVFEPQLLQVVRAGLARDGVLDDAAAAIALLDEPAADATEVRVAVGGGAVFAVRLEVIETRFFASCGAMDRGRSARSHRPAYIEARRLS